MSLQLLIIIPFIMQIAVIAGIVFLMSRQDIPKLFNHFAGQFQNYFGLKIEDYLKDSALDSVKINKTNNNAIKHGFLNFKDFQPWEKYLLDQLQMYPNTGFTGIVDRFGQARFV